MSAPSTLEGRVRFIMQQMVAGEWPEPGTPECLAHRQSLADAWGCSESTVRNYAAEASRNLRPDQGEREHLRQQLARRMKRIATKAERRRNTVTGLPDWRAAIDAWEKFGRYSGLDAEDEAQRPAPPTIVVQYADAHPVQSPSEPDASADATGLDDRDPVGPRRR